MKLDVWEQVRDLTIQFGKPAFVSNVIHFVNSDEASASIFLHGNGSVWVIQYTKGSHPFQFHRKDAPAVIEYYEDGQIAGEFWHINNRRHRADGPAAIYFNKDGSISYKEYWIDGKRKGDSNDQRSPHCNG